MMYIEYTPSHIPSNHQNMYKRALKKGSKITIAIITTSDGSLDFSDKCAKEISTSLDLRPKCNIIIAINIGT